MRTNRFVHLVARRGNSAEFPQNTLPAVRSALELGVRFIELDVQLSADGVPVVVRDRAIASARGVTVVGETRAAELAQIDVSEPARFGSTFQGTRIPQLADALGILDGRPDVTAFVTIGRASLARFGDEQVVLKVVQALKPFRSRCVIVAGNLPAVHCARRLADYPIGWTLSASDAHTRLKFEALKPDFIFCDCALLPGAAPLWRGPWRWVIQEVATLEVAVSLGLRGADFVATSHLRALSEAMRKLAADSRDMARAPASRR